MSAFVLLLFLYLFHSSALTSYSLTSFAVPPFLSAVVLFLGIVLTVFFHPPFAFTSAISDSGIPVASRVSARNPKVPFFRSEERRVGKECRVWWSLYTLKEIT